METVAAVIVTYNRLDELMKCIRSLRLQSYPLKHIIVFDNASSDGTPSWLLSQQDIGCILYEQNIGGAGGFHFALQEAYRQKFGWYWLMDDDCYPAENCLELLMSSENKEQYAGLAPTVYELGKIPLLHRGNLVYKPNLSILQVPIERPEKQARISEIDYASFVGLLLPHRSVTKVGFPRPEFFIHHDDVEYSLRLKRQAGPIGLVHEARIDHLMAASKPVDGKKKPDQIPLEKLWIRFFGIRNNIWLKRALWKELQSRHRLNLFLSFSKELSVQLCKVILFDDHKMKRMRFYFHAYRDGWYGNFDNAKPKKLLKL
ncbi:glycosyltransferase family 2 protein [Larkinella soli]|uniref:glycosyltransferase family 2 protein n=1 Tax=Larkinella soli TaxID=1770527 RepID=UPI000FFCA002|nr:glycosyltransferase family 2 protein [Larkinella soli]